MIRAQRVCGSQLDSFDLSQSQPVLLLHDITNYHAPHFPHPITKLSRLSATLLLLCTLLKAIKTKFVPRASSRLPRYPNRSLVILAGIMIPSVNHYQHRQTLVIAVPLLNTHLDTENTIQAAFQGL